MAERGRRCEVCGSCTPWTDWPRCERHLRSVNRANYQVVEKRADLIVIHDLGGPYPSVTNDAESVVDDLVREHALKAPTMRVVYRDSEGIYDELLVDDQGHFFGFHVIGARSLSEALERVRQR